MKQILGIIVILFFLASCNDKTKKTTHHSGEIITEQIVYDVPIVKSAESKLPDWLNNITGEGQLNYQQQILLNAENGAYKLFKDMEGTIEISLSEVMVANTLTDTIWMPSQSDPQEDTMTVISTTLGAMEITKIRFLEKWTFSKDKSEIYKEIIGFAPIRSQYGMDPWTGQKKLLGERILFWVRYDK